MKEYVLRLRLVQLSETRYGAAVFSGSQQLVELDKAYPTETDAAAAVLEMLAARVSFGETTLGEPATAACLHLLADEDRQP